MTAKKQTYLYKPQKEYVQKPWHKLLIGRIEKYNKMLTLRLLGKWLRIKRLNAPMPLDQVRSVLFIRYDALGDMIVTTPLWRLLKRLKPSIKIGVAGSYKNLDILRSDNDIDVTYDYSAGSLAEIKKRARAAGEEDWDVVLMCNFNQKTRNSVIARRSTRHGVTATVGSENKEGHQALFSTLVALPETERPMLMTEQLQYLLRSVIAIPTGAYERPTIKIDPATERATVVRIAALLESEQCSKYVIVNTDSPAFKKWGLGNNIALAEHIATTHHDVVVVLTALPENGKEIEEAITSLGTPRIHYVQTSDIHEMCTLIRHSSLVVTPDTSIVHLASAESKPVVAFYLAAGEWLPFGIPAEIFLPSKGDAIATIPFPLVCDGVDRMMASLTNELVAHQRITWTDRPSEFEIITLNPTANTGAQA
ncbi:MAG: glycosyltransferase family 9 protein [Bacteroidetes bacterium]|nr:glycosyltransferase family 9 protein [Bacteroidota bacterium]